MTTASPEHRDAPESSAPLHGHVDCRLEEYQDKVPMTSVMHSLRCQCITLLETRADARLDWRECKILKIKEIWL
jgi:hypothetical protein